MDGRIDKTWATHMVEYYTALKRKDTLIPAATWTNLEDIVLSESSQKQKARCCLTPLI